MKLTYFSVKQDDVSNLTEKPTVSIQTLESSVNLLFSNITVIRKCQPNNEFEETMKTDRKANAKSIL